MLKYSNEFKLEVVKYCIEHYHRYTEYAKYVYTSVATETLLNNVSILFNKID